MNKIESVLDDTNKTRNIFLRNIASSVQSTCLVMILFIWTMTHALAQSGHVGINVANPLAGLHVADSSVLFTGYLPAQQFHPLKPPPVSGAGTRMMWVSSHGAFRAGTVTGNQWDMSNLGGFSIAAGNDLTASGSNSSCFGGGNTTSGGNSFSAGLLNLTSGSNAATMGSNNIASGFNSTALGQNTRAVGSRSTSIGRNNISNDDATFSMGIDNRTRGNYSFVAGINNLSDGYGSFSIGRYIDTTADASIVSFDPDGTLFAAGNGSSNAARNNAMTILYNGNVGIDTKSPAYRLHVVNDISGPDGYYGGIMVENTNAGSPGEAAISFRNQSIPSSRQWMVGINESPPHLSFAYGTSFTTPNTHMMIDTAGNVGINTTNPQAPLHVIRNSPSGGVYHNNPLAIFESNNISYIQLSHETSDETGILSGNQITSIRSAIVFVADSSIDLRAGGNGTDLKISTEGNVGIGIYTPVAKLDVNGTIKLGTNGTVLSEVIKATINADVDGAGDINAGATLLYTFDVPTASVNSAVMVSPDAALPSGLVIAYARVPAAGDVLVKFTNTSSSDVTVNAMDYHITLIR